MVRLTLIARVADGLPLAEGLDSGKETDLDVYKSQAKVCRKHEVPELSTGEVEVAVGSLHICLHFTTTLFG